MSNTFLSSFTDLMTQAAQVYTIVDTVVDDEYTTVRQLTQTISDCALYEDSSAVSLVSDRFKAETDAVIIMDPSKLTTDILDTDEIDIAGRSFKVIHANNIMQLDDVLAVAVQEDKGEDA